MLVSYPDCSLLAEYILNYLDYMKMIIIFKTCNIINSPKLNTYGRKIQGQGN